MNDAVNIGYDKEFDAKYFIDTNEWVEDKCSDTLCEFCSTRPDKHITQDDNK